MALKLPVRTGDPLTSFEAAITVADATKTDSVRAGILAVLNECGPLTLDQLVDEYRFTPGRWSFASDSSIRTRCSELVKRGLVERVPDVRGKSRLGNSAHLWRAVPDERV